MSAACSASDAGCSPGRPSFLTLQWTALRDAPRHKSAPRPMFRIGRRAWEL
ncbi:DUF1534 domain-containing protein [Pseudomonas syringae USA011]|nr:DUF1534 domain-containing protein [Pseudomonas syringae USA011]